MRFTTATTAGLILASTASAAALPRPEAFQSIEELEAAVQARSTISEIAEHAAAAGRLGKDPNHNKINGAKGGLDLGAGGAAHAGKAKAAVDGGDLEHGHERREEEQDIEVVETRDTDRITLAKTKLALGGVNGAAHKIWSNNREYRRSADAVDQGGAFGGPSKWACRMM
ncbi:hypothetical protein SLS62_007091 [Diatrype stigma]|uniref:Uncharacterized protein n=1 Tax=Diatrype stigma TaxID=117547 RepID=A0AAN9UNR1_9PEZI